MAESNNSASPNPNGSISEFLDAASKAGVVGLFAIYIFGFLIVSIHDSSFGFSEVNPLKPKIASAGILFLLFLLIPLYSSMRAFYYRRHLDHQQSVACTLVEAFIYSLGSIAFGVAVTPLCVAKSPGYHLHLYWWYLFFAIPGAIFLLFLLGLFLRYLGDSHQRQPRRISLILVSLIALIAALEYIESSKSAPAVAALWFLGIGLIAAMLGRGLYEPGQRGTYDWTGLLIPTIGALAIFPSVLYPHIKSSWGGGSPVPVIIYFSRESRILPMQQMTAELLDESDAGIFVVRPNENKALFIPRAAVSALYFSDQPFAPDSLNTEPTQK